MPLRPTSLPPDWKIPEDLRARLGPTAGRQRAMAHAKHLLVVLHDPASPDDDERTPRFFWRRPDGSWQSTRSEPGVRALEAQIDGFETIIDELDDLEDDAQSAEHYLEIQRRLNPLLRAVRNMHEALQQARDLAKEDKRLIHFRDRAYALERKTDLLYNDVRHELNYVMVRQAEVQAEAAHRMAVASFRLNVMLAFFLPLGTFGAIFGMNLTHGLEGAWSPWVFVSVILLGFAAGFLLLRLTTGERGKAGDEVSGKGGMKE
jgi:F0F1-type ATP synthase assembly protein I